MKDESKTKRRFIEKLNACRYRAAELEKSSPDRNHGKALLRIVIASLPALVSGVDAERRYRFVNPGCREWFGVKSAAAIGKAVSEVIGQQASPAVRPDHAPGDGGGRA